jgi:plasmid maintenance system antidote protein VapI
MKKGKTMRNEIDIGGLILQILDEKDRKIAWLAREVGCDDSNLGKTLKNNKYIHYDLVYRISKAMDVDFFAYGTQKLKEEQNKETIPVKS